MTYKALSAFEQVDLQREVEKLRREVAERDALLVEMRSALQDVTDDLGRVRGNTMSCGHGWPCGCSKSKANKALSKTLPSEGDSQQKMTSKN